MDQTFESLNSLNGGFYEMLSYYSVVFLIIQVIIKFLPWIYENIGPIIAGPKLNLCEYGEWACKYKTYRRIGIQNIAQIKLLSIWSIV